MVRSVTCPNSQTVIWSAFDLFLLILRVFPGKKEHEQAVQLCQNKLKCQCLHTGTVSPYRKQYITDQETLKGIKANYLIVLQDFNENFNSI